MDTRSRDVLSRFVYDEVELTFEKREKLGLTRAQQLPTHKYIIEQQLTMVKEKPRTLPNKHDIVLVELTHEICNIWVFMNIPPLSRRHCQNRVKSLIDQYYKLSKTALAKRKENWKMQMEELRGKLSTGFDIKATDQQTIHRCIEEYGVVPGEEEKALYADNCCNGPRLRWCSGIDTVWWRDALVRKSKIDAQNTRKVRREEKIRNEREELKSLKSASIAVLEDSSDSQQSQSSQDADDTEFTTSTIDTKEFIVQSPLQSNKPSTQSRQESFEVTPSSLCPLTFPKVRIRTGYQTLNTNIMECLVVLESVYKIEGRKAGEVLKYVGNKCFGQDWMLCDDGDGWVLRDNGDECESDVVNDEELSDEPAAKKKRRLPGSLEFVIPSRKTVKHMIEKFAILSFADMAEQIQNAKQNEAVVTYGVDDTVKAGGNKKYDIKTGHITIISDNQQKETFTTGFDQNASHSGEDSAKTVKYNLAKMAVLTDNSYDDMLNMVDYFMTDRAGDGETMLNELNVEKKRRLKCSAHVLLTVEAALDKVFKDIETVIGVSSLISPGASHCFNAPKNSVWYLGLLALAKLLSPSHSKESISLYVEYTNFMKNEASSSSSSSELSAKLIKQGFKGFQANRFGRMGEISAAMVAHKPLIDKFFEKQVYEHSNKLVLAVNCYKESEWFLLCCQTNVYFFESVTLKIKRTLGIDEFKKSKDRCTTWVEIKAAFKEITNHLENVSCTETKLIGKCAKQIKLAIERQLGMSNFFLEGNDEDIPDEKTPKTNLGCESEFGHVTNDLRKSGGSTSLSTISNKHIVGRNKYYENERWKSLSSKEKRAKWKWASNSPQANLVMAMEKEFTEQVKAVEVLPVKAKENAKRKKDGKVIQILEECKMHGGPLTVADIEKIDTLSDEQVVAEASYLKKTMAPNIRFKRKVDNKFVKFTTEELRQQIKDAIKPTFDQGPEDLGTLIERVLCDEDELTGATGGPMEMVGTVQVGTVGWWSGVLEEDKVEVLVEESSLQLYKLSRYGFKPCGLPVDHKEWTLKETISDYQYVVKGADIFLVI